jgi:hypothetical protein
MPFHLPSIGSSQRKFDAYAGLMYTQIFGGLANGFLNRTNVDPTVGLRF